MSSQAKKSPAHSEEIKGKGPDNEIRVKASTYTRTYLAYIARLFKENHDKVVIRGTGFAIPRAVALAMLVRKRFKGLHQIAEIGINEFDDRDFTRKVGLINITLSKKPLDKNHIGYSEPLPDNEVTEYQPYLPGAELPGRAEGEAPRRARTRGTRFGVRGRGRGFRGRGGYGGGYGSGYGGGYGGGYSGYGRRGRRGRRDNY